MTLQERQVQFTEMVGRLIGFATAHGFRLRFGDAWRSSDPLKCPGCGELHSYQELLVYNGRSKTKHSEHLNRCAVDFVVENLDKSPMSAGRYRILGEFWESMFGQWGGRFMPLDQDGMGYDPGHFQLADSTEV